MFLKPLMLWGLTSILVLSIWESNCDNSTSLQIVNSSEVTRYENGSTTEKYVSTFDSNTVIQNKKQGRANIKLKKAVKEKRDPKKYYEYGISPGLWAFMGTVVGIVIVIVVVICIGPVTLLNLIVGRHFICTKAFWSGCYCAKDDDDDAIRSQLMPTSEGGAGETFQKSKDYYVRRQSTIDYD